MSGHNKWSQIKHKKAKEDAKKGKTFTKLIKEITLAARAGGDPNGNARLRLLLEKAKEANMPQENAVRAIKRGTGEIPGAHYEECLYEGYGPCGVAVIAAVLTDNKNRTVGELRHMFAAHGGNLAESGSVSWMFKKMGVIMLQETVHEDKLLEIMIDYDADVRQSDDTVSIICDPKQIELIRKKMVASGIAVESADIEWIVNNGSIELEESEEKKVLVFLQELQDHDDTQNVFSNLA
jgi:YebC/PmpR family DNA-binding regulatory protein